MNDLGVMVLHGAGAAFVARRKAEGGSPTDF